jgi:beta-lactamase class A
MEYALLQISQGVGCLDDVISGRTLREHIERMIQLTCNTATSHVIRYFGRGNIDTWLAEHHSSTRLNYDFANFYHGGRRNSSSVLECIAHLERVFHNRAEEPYAHMYEILLNSQVRDRLPMATNHLPYVSVATKTGSFIDRGEAVDHDMGIVTATDDNGNIVVAYAIVILTYSAAIDGSVFPARPTLIAVARDIYEQFEEFAHSNT